MLFNAVSAGSKDPGPRIPVWQLVSTQQFDSTLMGIHVPCLCKGPDDDEARRVASTQSMYYEGSFVQACVHARQSRKHAGPVLVTLQLGCGLYLAELQRGPLPFAPVW